MSNFATISPHGLNPPFQAALAAARSKSDLVDDEHFDEAIDQIMSGLKKRNAVSYKDEKRTLAVIEGGKCLLSWLLASQVILLEIFEKFLGPFFIRRKSVLIFISRMVIGSPNLIFKSLSRAKICY